MFGKSPESSKTFFSTIFISTLALFSSFSNAKVYSRCDFVHQLHKYGVPKWQIPTLTCIAYWESSLNASKVDPHYGTYGVFQISEDKWCSQKEKPGKICDVTCSKLLDHHLRDDIDCALRMYKLGKETGLNGYDVWDAYYPHCSVGNNHQYVKNCDKKYRENNFE